MKAAAGGGGRGMRDRPLAPASSTRRSPPRGARRRPAFGDDRVYLERYLERPRHIEIQLLADTHGTVLSLGERECSVQRRHQKVLEESPSTALDPDLRARMSDAAVRFARAIGYVGAGTAEFVLEGREFFFLELNGRIQVEHPVTEAVTGHRPRAVAAADRARRAPRRCVRRSDGAAVEVRLYAEDPRTFLPQAGRIERLRLPASVRVEAGVAEGDEVGTSYDPMIAKLIARGATRDEALDRLARGARRDRGRRRDDEPALPALARRASGAARGRDDDGVPRPSIRRSPRRRPRCPTRSGAAASGSTCPPPAPRPPPDVDAAARAHRGAARRLEHDHRADAGHGDQGATFTKAQQSKPASHSSYSRR